MTSVSEVLAFISDDGKPRTGAADVTEVTRALTSTMKASP
jgi:hypothetical protein